MFKTRVLETIRTHIFSKNCAIYEIIWKIMVEADGPHMTIQYCAEKM